MSHRFAIIGDSEVDVHEGDQVPGGAAAIAVSLANSGGVTLRSAVGGDEQGATLLGLLDKVDVATPLVDRIAEAETIVSIRDADGGLTQRTPGAHLVRGAMMDIYDLFGHDVLVLDASDQPLRRFLTDLPAHTKPDVRMIGTMRHLDWRKPTPDELEIAMRLDMLVGTPRQYAALTGEDAPDDALRIIRERMPGTHLRTAVVALPGAVAAVGREGTMRVAWPSLVPDLCLLQVVAATAILLARRAPLTELSRGPVAG